MRSLKPQKVDTVWNRITLKRADIMLDRNNLVFYTIIDGRRCCEAPSAHECKAKAQVEVDRQDEYDWKQFIFIDKFERSDNMWDRDVGKYKADLEIRFWRLEIAFRTDKGARDKQEVERPFLNEAGLTDKQEKDLAEMNHPGFEDSVEANRARRRAELVQSNKNDRQQGVDIRSHSDYNDLRIPYSTKTWDTLMGIKGAIDKAYNQLLGLLDGKAEEVQKRLLSVGSGAKLLSSGE